MRSAFSKDAPVTLLKNMEKNQARTIFAEWAVARRVCVLRLIPQQAQIQRIQWWELVEMHRELLIMEASSPLLFCCWAPFPYKSIIEAMIRTRHLSLAPPRAFPWEMRRLLSVGNAEGTKLGGRTYAPLWQHYTDGRLPKWAYYSWAITWYKIAGLESKWRTETC